jgi:glycosyltransferase involved in cell wall biosynthesis
LGVPGIPLPHYPELRLLLPPADLTRRLALFNPDVVHVADPMVLGAAGIVARARLGVPVVTAYHTNLAAYCSYFGVGALEGPLWAYRRMLHARAALTLCPSPSAARQLECRGFARVQVWPRGVASALFSPQQHAAEWRRHVTNGDPCRPNVLYVGRLSFEKNLDILLATHEAVRTQAGVDAQLVLVGDGPARTELEQAADHRRVTFTGFLHGAQLARAYASADLFAFPSLTETFGQVVQKPWRAGCPSSPSRRKECVTSFDLAKRASWCLWATRAPSRMPSTSWCAHPSTGRTWGCAGAPWHSNTGGTTCSTTCYAPTSA